MEFNQKEYNRKYYINHREEQKKYHKEYYQRNKDKALEYAKVNRETIKEKRKKRHANNRRKILDKLGYVCARCGFSDMRALQIDHINGGGETQRKEMNWAKYTEYLANLSDEELHSKYQILCANCNQIKRIENGEHKKAHVPYR